jgi:Rps23 Pro-64 3,4-dihydroxylase Tpa1-like proline 4-hydroxylase
VQVLERLTGIPRLLADPHLRGGGMHSTARGGYLKLHADFNFHQDFGLFRRVNVFLFLNDGWEEEWGGHLELWNEAMQAPGGGGTSGSGGGGSAVARLLPIFNRMVIFTSTSASYHGHPDPLACPVGRARNSLAMYYYTKERPADEQPQARSTAFRLRPGEEPGVGCRAGDTARYAGY